MKRRVRLSDTMVWGRVWSPLYDTAILHAFEDVRDQVASDVLQLLARDVLRRADAAIRVRDIMKQVSKI